MLMYVYTTDQSRSCKLCSFFCVDHWRNNEASNRLDEGKSLDDQFESILMGARAREREAGGGALKGRKCRSDVFLMNKDKTNSCSRGKFFTPTCNKSSTESLVLIETRRRACSSGILVGSDDWARRISKFHCRSARTRC